MFANYFNYDPVRRSLKLEYNCNDSFWVNRPVPHCICL